MSALAGKRVLVTRAAEQSSALADLLRERGAEPVIAPTIEIVAPADAAPIDAMIAGLATFDWIAFTSAAAVRRFCEELTARGVATSACARARIAAVGPGTAAALQRAGLAVDCLADEHHGEGLAKAMLAHAKAGERVLLPRALVARDVLPSELGAAGLAVTVVPVYETRKPTAPSFEPAAAAFVAGGIDAVTLTSGSTATHLFELLEAHTQRARELLDACVIVSIGPITTEAAAALGIRVDGTADPHTLADLVRVLEGLMGRKPPRSP